MKTRTFITILFFMLISSLFANGKKDNVHKLIQNRTDQIFDSIVKIRRTIHQNPELSGKEVETSKLVAKQLKALGLKVITNVGGYGVVGILKGSNPGPVIGWRADMDALAWKINEKSDIASKNKGIRHICGHDVHTAIALGIAEVMTSIKDKLHGSIVFIFQPSEENFQGAREMINDGLFDIAKPKILYALHIAPLPYNTISTKPKEMFSYRRIILNIKLKGSKNTVETQKKIIEFLKKLNTHSFQEIANIPLSDPVKGLFSPKSPLTNYFFISKIGTAKEDNSTIIQPEIYSSSKTNISKKIKEIKRSKWNDLIESITYTVPFWNTPVYNDPKATETASEIISSIYGKKIFIPLHGVTIHFAEDFSLYQKKIPGVFYFLGGSNFEKGIVSFPHTQNFAVDENCIKTGINYFSSLMYESLLKK